MALRILKLIIIIFILNLMPSHAGHANDQVYKTLSLMSSKLMEEQRSDGRFEGAFEADPGFELLSLVLIKQYGQRDLLIEKQFIEKALKWNTESGFGSYPFGPYNHDVTGLVLLSLKELGYQYSDFGLDKIFQNFEANGGIDKLNLGTKILLAPLNLASMGPLKLIVGPTLIKLPGLLPFSQKNLGIFRSLLIPLASWNYYKSQNEKQKKGDNSNQNQNKTAANGIQWILDHQMPNGTWYTLFHAIINISALNEAQKAGVGNYSEQIKKAIEAIINWRTINFNGEITQQLTLTTGWDTAQTLIAFSEQPEEIKSLYSKQIAKSIQFLDQNQIKEKGDWAINTPDLLPGGWSFIVENRDYPDTDVVAAVLEGKNNFSQFSDTAAFDRGLNWLLGLQNKDGGFPAWEKNVSKLTDKIIKTIFPALPDYSDLSQSDVTARIARLLHKLINDPKTPDKLKEELQTSLLNSCRFILKDSVKKREVFWKGRWLVAYLYGTSEALDTLVSTGCKDVEEMVPTLNWIISKQNADGGFGEDHQSFIANKFIAKNSTVMQTSYVVQGLISYEERFKEHYGIYSPFKENLDRAMDFLIIKAEEDNGLIKERSFAGVIGAKLWYANYALGPQFMTLRALGRYYKLDH